MADKTGKHDVNRDKSFATAVAKVRIHVLCQWSSDLDSQTQRCTGNSYGAAGEKISNISDAPLRTARNRLKVITRKLDFEGGWIWEMPDSPLAINAHSTSPPDVT